MPSTCNPYYSIDEHGPKTYHTYTDCPTGKKVHIRYKRSGTNDWPRCESCIRMD